MVEVLEDLEARTGPGNRVGDDTLVFVSTFQGPGRTTREEMTRSVFVVSTTLLVYVPKHTDRGDPKYLHCARVGIPMGSSTPLTPRPSNSVNEFHSVSLSVDPSPEPTTKVRYGVVGSVTRPYASTYTPTSLTTPRNREAGGTCERPKMNL